MHAPNPAPTSLVCSVFRQLSRMSWQYLEKARRVKYQPGEETLTDLNLIELKDLLPRQVVTQTFTKPQEGLTGADWEWWFTGKSGQWIGFRVQAKILNLDSESYEHLHYKKSDGSWQVDKLIGMALADGLIPIYCLYLETQWTPKSSGNSFRCGTFPMAMEDYGCSLLSAFDVQSLRPELDLPTVFPHTYPWHCLVCCPLFDSVDLPHRVFDFWKNTIISREIINVQDSVAGPADDQRTAYGDIRLKSEPPPHIYQLIEGQLDAHPDPNIRGVLVATDSEFAT